MYPACLGNYMEPGGYSSWNHKRFGHDLETKQQQMPVISQSWRVF